MFGSDRSGLDAHLATITGALRWRVLAGILYAAGASAVALAALGFVVFFVRRAQKRAFLSSWNATGAPR